MMTAETASEQKDAEPSRAAPIGEAPDAEVSRSPIAPAAGWLGHEILLRPPNTSVRTLAMRRAQQTYGNSHVQRILSKSNAGAETARAVQLKCACGGTCPRCKAPEAGADSATAAVSAAGLSASAKQRLIRPKSVPDDGAKDAARTMGIESTASGREGYLTVGRYAPATAPGQSRSAPSSVGLVLSQPGDPYEVEADRVAEAVVAPDADVGTGVASRGDPGSRPASEGSRLGPSLKIGEAGATNDAPGAELALGSGRPLERPVRDFMESRFFRDFDRVRVHTDTAAAVSAHSLGAMAFTTGRDIVFAEGRYRPATGEGRKLLAHELTHVLQHEEGTGAGPLPAVRRTIDAAHSSITPAAVKPLSNQEITEQIGLVRAQLATIAPTSPEFATLQTNERLLQEEQVLRGVEQKAPAAGTAESDLDQRVARFKQTVLQTAIVRLTLNQQNLERRRAFLTSKLTPLQVQQESLGTVAADLEQTAVRNQAYWTFNEWAGEPSARRRWVLEHQIKGQYRACTGCHLMLRADELDKIDPIGGLAALTPAQRLGGMAGIGPARIPTSPSERAEHAPFGPQRRHRPPVPPRSAPNSSRWDPTATKSSRKMS